MLSVEEREALRPRSIVLGAQSGYRYVYRDGRRWRVLLPENGKMKSKGGYASPREAAEAAAAHLRAMRGPEWFRRKKR